MNASPPPKQIVSGDGWGKAQVFPPPSFLSSTGLSHQEGANAAQIHPSPNFPLPRPPSPIIPPTPPISFYQKKMSPICLFPIPPLIFAVRLIFTQPCLQLLKLRRTEFSINPPQTQEPFGSSKGYNVSLPVHSAATTFCLMQLNATDTTNETQLT